MARGADRGRCATHDLALGPSGECVLCRRTLAPPPRRAFPLALLGVGALALLGVSIGASRWLRTPAPTLTQEVSITEEPIVPDPQVAVPEARTASAPPSRLPSSAALLRDPHDEAGEAAASPPPPSGEPTADALATARGRVSITMYSTSWCGVCARARAYLDEHHIRYTEHDVERSDRYQRLMRELNPAGGVPTFDIDRHVLVGFGPDALEQTIDEAALAHIRP